MSVQINFEMLFKGLYNMCSCCFVIRLLVATLDIVLLLLLLLVVFNESDFQKLPGLVQVAVE